MSNNRHVEVLVREGIRESVAPATVGTTYRVGVEHDGLLAAMLPHIETMRAHLRAGNVEAALRSGHLVAGRSARLGERRLAGLVRRAIVMSRFHVVEQACDMLTLAEQELISRN